MRARLVFALAAISALAAAGPAAAFTDSEVETPADGAYFVADETDGPSLQIQGTVQNPGPGDDSADLVCDTGNSNGDNPVGGRNDVDASTGSFTVTLNPEDLRVGTCRLLLVPDGVKPSTDDISGYDGPVVTTDYRSTFRTKPSDASPNLLYDFYYSQQQQHGLIDYESIGSCGVCDLTLFDPVTRRNSEYVFWGNGYFNQAEPPPYNRSPVRVNGKNAYPSYEAATMSVQGGSGDAATDFTGVPELGFTPAQTGRGESLTITETSHFVVCEGSGDQPVTKAGCKSWKDSGVQYRRVLAQSREGTLALVDDEFSSSDGAEHALELDWRQAFRDVSPVAGSYQFPWIGAAYAPHDDGDKIPPPPDGAPAAIYTKTNKDRPDGDFLWPQGLIMFDTPAGEIFWTSSEHFYIPMSRTVPATGTVRIRQAYAGAATRAELEAIAVPLEDKWVAPKVAITTPAEGATVSTATIDVAGTASDNKSTPKVTVNGQEMTVGAGGDWTGKVTLQPGANTLTAVARDAQGTESTATRSVTYTPPLPPPPPPADLVAPTLSAVSLSAKTFRVAAGATAVAAAAKRGTTVRYTLSEPATVSFAVARATKGRRVAGRCRKQTLKNRRKRTCTRYVRAGRTITRKSPAGASTLRFTGRIGTKKLKPGRYRMTIVAADAAGNKSQAKRLKFRVVRR